MQRYALQRLVLIIPFVLFVLYSLFVLTRHFPIDPVLQSLNSQGVDIQNHDNLLESDIYLTEKVRLGLDRPPFYLSIGPSQISRAIPSIRWLGIDNQFHHWLGKLLTFDFGKAAVDGQDAGHKTLIAVGYTLRYMIPSILLTYVIAILLGLFIGQKPEHWLRRFISTKLYIISAVPLFWIASLCVIYLTTPLYGKWLDIFPAVDVIVGGHLPVTYYILPILIVTYHSLAYLTIAVKNLYIDQAKSPYITGLKARGIDPSQINRKHILLNLMVPLTTLLTKAIPMAVGGSIIIEQIFNIPGIGRLLLKSIQSSDWNVTVPIICLVAVVTVLSYLLADVLYTYFDPRIQSTLEG